MGKWRHLRGSVPGTSHLRSGRPCQDSALCGVLGATALNAVPDNAPDGTAGAVARQNIFDDVLVAVVSDGAGSASHSEFGSYLTCSLFMDEMKSLMQTGRGAADIDDAFMADWLCRLRHEITVRAEEAGVSPRAFACTLLAAVVAPDRAVFIQIGDGAIVYAMDEEPETFRVPIWPQQGEYENTTYFATEPGAADRLICRPVLGVCDQVALFSDGLQRLALSFADKEPYPPFFRPLFATLEKAADVAALEKPLMAFLSSPRVNDRTDDDKTLIIASRRPDHSFPVPREITDVAAGPSVGSAHGSDSDNGTTTEKAAPGDRDHTRTRPTSAVGPVPPAMLPTPQKPEPNTTIANTIAGGRACSQVSSATATAPGPPCPALSPSSTASAHQPSGHVSLCFEKSPDKSRAVTKNDGPLPLEGSCTPARRSHPIKSFSDLLRVLEDRKIRDRGRQGNDRTKDQPT